MPDRPQPVLNYVTTEWLLKRQWWQPWTAEERAGMVGAFDERGTYLAGFYGNEAAERYGLDRLGVTIKEAEA